MNYFVKKSRIPVLAISVIFLSTLFHDTSSFARPLILAGILIPAMIAISKGAQAVTVAFAFLIVFALELAAGMWSIAQNEIPPSIYASFVATEGVYSVWFMFYMLLGILRGVDDNRSTNNYIIIGLNILLLIRARNTFPLFPFNELYPDQQVDHLSLTEPLIILSMLSVAFDHSYRKSTVLALLICLLTSVVCQARSSIMIEIMLITLYLLRWRRLKLIIGLSGSLAGVVATASLIAVLNESQRFAILTEGNITVDSSAMARLAQIEYAIELLGNPRTWVLGDIFAPYQYFGGHGNYAHNALSIVADYGIPGALLFILLWRNLFSLSKNTQNPGILILIAAMTVSILLFKSRTWAMLYLSSGIVLVDKMEQLVRKGLFKKERRQAYDNKGKLEVSSP